MGGRKFLPGEREQVEMAHAPGEGLGDALLQSELVGTGQDEPPHAGICVETSLEGREQDGRALHLIEDGAVGVTGEKAAGIVDGEGLGIGVFEADVGLGGERGSREGGFSGLTGSGEGDGGIPLGELDEDALRGSVNHMLG